MATQSIEEVKKAQGDWQTPVNKVINAVNGLLGGVEPTHLANPISCINGTTVQHSDAYYWKAGKYKLVLLDIYNMAGSQDAITHYQSAFQVPDEIKPIVSVRMGLTQDVMAADQGNGNFVLWARNGAKLTDMSGSVLYLANN